jgi:uncharacterized protein
MSPGRSQSSVASVTDTVDALLLAARGATEVREFRMAELPRLSDLAVDEHAQARISGRFHLVDGRVGIVGRANANLRLVCQRCLGAVQVPVDDEFHVVLIDSEAEMDQLPDEQEAVIVDATRLELSWLLEEQLLLALPLVPTHASTAECEQSSAANGSAAPAVAVAEMESPSVKAQETQRPFANLRELLNTEPKKGSHKTTTGSSGKG